MKIILAGILLTTGLTGCGVKGRPLPPLEKIEPGDGVLRGQEEERKRQKALPPAATSSEGG